MIHLSIDDFLFTFKDLTDNQEKYKSLFDQPIFRFFRKLHEAYMEGYNVGYGIGYEAGIRGKENGQSEI
jgi:hypothetical protein